MSWRAGARLFRDMWPLLQVHLPESEFRQMFQRDLLEFFAECDMDPTDLRRFHPELDQLLDELGVSEG